MRRVSEKDSAYCPTCESYTSQERTPTRGVRLCHTCGHDFTLTDSRAAEIAWRESEEGQAIIARARELRRAQWLQS